MKFLLQHRIAIAIWVLVPVNVLAPNRSLSQTSSQGARKVLSQVVPLYPNLARPMRIQGTVKADVLVAPDGSVKSVEIKGGHPLFVQAAQNALRQWKWEAAPHETHEIIELRFKL